ncbi:TPA: hypothetical protein ACP32N_005026 [Pseudomonas aeruginosa]
MHISIFHSIKTPLLGHRFAYGTLAEDYKGNNVVAKVVFFNSTAQMAGMCAVNINNGKMPSSDDILQAYTSRNFTLMDNQAIVQELLTALIRDSKQRAESHTRLNLKPLAEDVLAWRRTGQLQPNSHLSNLARICAEYASAGDDHQEAERLVTNEALKRASTAWSDNEE